MQSPRFTALPWLLLPALVNHRALTPVAPRSALSDAAALKTAIEAENARFSEAFDPPRTSPRSASSTPRTPRPSPRAPSPSPAGRGPGTCGRELPRCPWDGSSSTTVEVDGNGHTTAWETGRYALIGTNGSNLDEGKYIVLWKGRLLKGGSSTATCGARTARRGPRTRRQETPRETDASSSEPLGRESPRSRPTASSPETISKPASPGDRPETHPHHGVPRGDDEVGPAARAPHIGKPVGVQGRSPHHGTHEAKSSGRYVGRYFASERVMPRDAGRADRRSVPRELHRPSHTERGPHRCDRHPGLVQDHRMLRPAVPSSCR